MDINRILTSVMGTAGSVGEQAMTKARSSGLPSGLVGGAAAGGLAALILSNKKARKMGGKALKYGGMAAIGGLAYKAWSDYKAQNPPAPATQAPQPGAAIPAPPSGSIFDLAADQPDAGADDIRLTVIQAMISAAKADGHIDGMERQRIEARIAEMQLDQDEKMFLVDQLKAPSDPIAIARLSSSDEQSAEIYLASALAVDTDTPEEQRYLDRLADALRMDGALRAHLDAQARGVAGLPGG